MSVEEIRLLRVTGTREIDPVAWHEFTTLVTAHLRLGHALKIAISAYGTAEVSE